MPDTVDPESLEEFHAPGTQGQQGRLWSRGGILLATTEQLAWYR